MVKQLTAIIKHHGDFVFQRIFHFCVMHLIQRPDRVDIFMDSKIKLYALQALIRRLSHQSLIMNA